MSGQDLMSELGSYKKLLSKALSAHRQRGEEYAMAEKIYRIEHRKAILEEREKGAAVTILSDIVKGREDIAELRFKRDVAETLLKSAEEAINVYKLQMKILDGQIQREWGRSE